MADREKVLDALENCLAKQKCRDCPWKDCEHFVEHVNMPKSLAKTAYKLLKEQEAEIRQLRLALDIAKGTCKGIKPGGGQFADMPTMQSAT